MISEILNSQPLEVSGSSTTRAFLTVVVSGCVGSTNLVNGYIDASLTDFDRDVDAGNARLGALATETVLRRFWDRPEEIEACQDL